jgi:hypothetical protein
VFAFAQTARPDLADLERAEALVRARYDLSPEDIVLVTEEPARLPGAPARMTTILFWTDTDTRHRLRLFKPVAQIGDTDVPQPWLRRALRDDGEADCC